MSLTKLFSNKVDASEKEGHWIPLSDLMTGLMLMFLLIAMVFMVKVEAESKEQKRERDRAEDAKNAADRAKNEAETARREAETAKTAAVTTANHLQSIGVLYSDVRKKIFKELEVTFQNELKNWDAQLIERDLTIRFNEPTGKFKTGDAVLPDKFKSALDEFIPRYVGIISKPEYRDSIEEVRIEGHTSSFWKDSKSPREAYFQNMALSQNRTRSTLEYVVTRPSISPKEYARLISKITANGLSSSRLRLTPEGTEDANASQRVEFRLRLNADERLEGLLAEAVK